MGVAMLLANKLLWREILPKSARIAWPALFAVRSKRSLALAKQVVGGLQAFQEARKMLAKQRQWEHARGRVQPVSNEYFPLILSNQVKYYILCYCLLLSSSRAGSYLSSWGSGPDTGNSEGNNNRQNLLGQIVHRMLMPDLKKQSAHLPCSQHMKRKRDRKSVWYERGLKVSAHLSHQLFRNCCPGTSSNEVFPSTFLGKSSLSFLDL